MLSGFDQKLLRDVLLLGHALETIWPTGESEGPSPQALSTLEGLVSMIKSLESLSESHDVKRLAFHSGNLSAKMTARHLSAILVPFERLAGRALRDDEIAGGVREGDRPEAARAVKPMVAIADNIRSAFNVGAILRTAEAFGMEEVILSGYTPTPEEEKTGRTSMGAQNFVPWRSVAKARDAVVDLKKLGYAILALETAESAQDVATFAWPEKCALLLGNERFGLDRELLAEADHLVRIPLHGKKNSLNVGIAFGIAAAAWRSGAARDGEKHELEPIGFFRASSVHAYEAPRQGVVDRSAHEACIELASGKMFEQALEGLSGFERVWLVYRFHRNDNWKPMVMPPRGPRTKQGVFATRSPHRPNALGLSCVELVRVEGRRIFVRGFDLLDGTPIYDIKPYLPYADSFPGAKAGWAENLQESSFEVRFSRMAETQIAWLEERGVSQLRGFLATQLEFDPLDDERKRVKPLDEGRHEISYRTWRTRFSVLVESSRIVMVEEIGTGYSERELEPSAEDPYRDKDLHREFAARSWSRK